MRVQVIEGQKGYDGHALRKDGDVFTIPDEPSREALTKVEIAASRNGRVPQVFSERWMRAVSESTPNTAPKKGEQTTGVFGNRTGNSGSTGNREVL